VLRLSLEEGRDKSALVLRQGRAIKWIEEGGLTHRVLGSTPT